MRSTSSTRSLPSFTFRIVAPVALKSSAFKRHHVRSGNTYSDIDSTTRFSPPKNWYKGAGMRFWRQYQTGDIKGAFNGGVTGRSIMQLLHAGRYIQRIMAFPKFGKFTFAIPGRYPAFRPQSWGKPSIPLRHKNRHRYVRIKTFWA
jgi:hypothetical protein